MLLAIIIKVASAIRKGYQSWLMRLSAESCPQVANARNLQEALYDLRWG
jgi:hypothetical protein